MITQNIKTMEDFFTAFKNKKDDFYCPSYERGQSKTIKEFYKDIIEPNLPEKEIVLKWHKLLTSYIQHDDMIVFIRKYASGKGSDDIITEEDYEKRNNKKKNWNIRRGFLTQLDDGFRYAYVDNFLAHIVYFMAINGFVPEESDFRKYITDFKMPVGFMETSEEKYKTFGIMSSVGLMENKWKLSHMFSANSKAKVQEYKNLKYYQMSDTLFPIGEYKDWDNSEKIRHIAPPDISKFTDVDYKEIMKAHFLRVCHPMNYFLTPGKNYHVSISSSPINQDNNADKKPINNPILKKVGGNKLCSDIGEYEPLIQYVYLQMKKRYGNELGEFENLIFGNIVIDKTEEELENLEINIIYKRYCGTPEFLYTEQQQAQIFYNYLFNGDSPKRIANEVFKDVSDKSAKASDSQVSSFLKNHGIWEFKAIKTRKTKGIYKKTKLEDINTNEMKDIALKEAVEYIKENINNPDPTLYGKRKDETKSSKRKTTNNENSDGESLKYVKPKKEKKVKTTTARTHSHGKFSDKQKAQCCYAFLFRGIGMRGIEISILKKTKEETSGSNVKKYTDDLGLTGLSGRFKGLNLFKIDKDSKDFENIKSAIEFMRNNLNEEDTKELDSYDFSKDR